ncbi:MAG: hypothetical protein PHT33_11400, partial [bacterium]|nr:hypothetical protein [bacterium]
VRTDPVSDDPVGREVERARLDLAGQEFDLLIICIAGWIPSHTVMRLIDDWSHKPMLLWGLRGWRDGDRFVTTADQAGTTALRRTMQDMGFRFKYIVDYMDREPDDQPILSFARATQAAARLRHARVGMMGCRDMNLYATLHDGISLRRSIGPEIENFEMLEMVQRIQRLDAVEVAAAVRRMKERWQFVSQADGESLSRAAELYLAVSAKAVERGYEGVSLIDVDGVKKLLGFPPAPVFMLLAEDGLCTIPENDVPGAVTQLMTTYVTGQIAAYMEIYEFSSRGMLIGVPDYIPSEITDGPVKVMPSAFGHLGQGLLNVSEVRPGQITLARLLCAEGCYSLHLATGKAERPQPWEEAGWAPPAPQLPGLQVKLDGAIEDFIQQVGGQHYILSYGDNRPQLIDLCQLLKIEVLS